jgi:hypothetical protein
MPPSRAAKPVQAVLQGGSTALIPLGAQKRLRTSDATFRHELVQRNDLGAARRPY